MRAALCWRGVCRVGPYFGAYSDFEAFARGALGYTRQIHPETDLARVGLDLHLERQFWTVERDGTLYAFRLDDEAEEVATEAKERARIRRILRARFGEHALTEAVPVYAGRYQNLPEFIRDYVWRLPYPTWLLMHVDVYTIGYSWCVDQSIFTIAAAEGGMHVFIRRDPLSHWRYQIPA